MYNDYQEHKPCGAMKTIENPNVFVDYQGSTFCNIFCKINGSERALGIITLREIPATLKQGSHRINVVSNLITLTTYIN